MYPVVTLRRKYNANAALGTFILPSGKVLKTLERPWLNNQSNISCYPEGVYLVKWLPRSASGKYKRVWHVQNVPGRVGILIHKGNLVRHTRGCTLPGKRHGVLNDQPAVLASKTGMNAMRRELSGQDFILIVTGNQNG